ncbi:MAG: hypothetical protein A3I24_04445 [Candidatus Harrisonbacteria bacterium RIFCSPLOWO2_02_FULL_41_13b]|uniref:Uncharacterized protein n=1 Tax=Candidatus Harrisonbacteria bacterium RIFCSPLOWO2_02_FULL_41_13b TaxID=1798409 RepID=A0A1G1ZQF3_9BACT|nr:MAG: hypothetical protein A3J53_02675 [Candidatus Harrisonbacteria bacterium RIFCSPHIGHO2_02_FULL_40_20]OGY66741.1 MAG: hypothetical protein A3I24_04445 [Candidatus Harrisonbacteria bacterium RIFCSPLOWO2_02_FULL_41_13b]
MIKLKVYFSKDFLVTAIIFLFAVLASGFIIQATYAQVSRNSSISFKKDSQGLFTVTIRDPQGIKEFSLQPKGKFPYGGGISQCPTSRVIANVAFDDPFDFTPAMGAYVIDCQNNQDDLQIPSPKDGLTVSARVGVEAELKKESVQEAPASVAPVKPTSAPEKAPLAEIIYPVAELGNCGTEFECRAYCDQPENLNKCVAFAESHGLMTKEDADLARKFKDVVKNGGPGGCNSQQSCEAYCNDIDHIDTCLVFAEQHEILSGKELEEAKKVQSAIKRGAKMPGNCRSKGACEAYCTNSDNMDECIAFAKENGFMTEEELREVEKFLPLMKSGQTPGACKSKTACEAYCEAEGNFDECIAFAEKAGLISDEELKHIDKFKKAGGVGPGGCRGRSCQTYCEKPENQKACFAWAKENGFIEEADLRRMEEGKQQLKKALEQMPPEAKECVDAIIGPGGLEGDFVGGPEIGDQIRVCFEQAFSQFSGPGGPGEHGGFPGGDFSGPGGCTSEEECQVYCQENPDDCQGFGPPGGGGGPGGGGSGGGGFSGPGGCSNPTECMSYCKEHYNDPACSAFGGGVESSSVPSQNYQQQYQQSPLVPQYIQPSGGSSYEIPITPELCVNFQAVPACSYVGAPDSQNYQLCKKCYPDK